MPKKPDITKLILNILTEKQAVSIDELKNRVIKVVAKDKIPDIKSSYAVTRSLKNLKISGAIEEYNSPQKEYLRLSKVGKQKIHSLKLSSDTSLIPSEWDGFWRMILLDIPEERKNERESIRYLLKKAGFVCLKNSAWVSPYPFEHMFINIKKDLGFTTEIIVIVTKYLDEETDNTLKELFRIN